MRSARSSSAAGVIEFFSNGSLGVSAYYALRRHILVCRPTVELYCWDVGKASIIMPGRVPSGKISANDKIQCTTGEDRSWVGRVLINLVQCPLFTESDRIVASPRNDAMGQFRTHAVLQDQSYCVSSSAPSDERRVAENGNEHRSVARLRSLQSKLAQPGMIVGPGPERPMIFALALGDRQVVDAGDAPAHQAVLGEFPIFVPI